MSAPVAPASPPRLQYYVVYKGTIETRSGLHIGGSKDDLEIGGTDLPVIAHPITQEPYIPGSSLKGKLRSLLELKYGKYDNKGEPCGCAQRECPVCTLFGPHKNTRHRLGPTRLLMRDAPLTEESRAWLRTNQREDQANPFVGLKSENSINRLTGVARDPRVQEVVPAGVCFALECSLRVFEGDDEEGMMKHMNEAFAMLQLDALGASGSRGGGKVALKFEQTVRKRC